MTTEYRYAGPDGDGIGGLPPGVGAAVGSDYCVHLLPGPDDLERAISAVRARGVPLLLLTPYFRDAELKRALPLFRAIPQGDDVTVAINDWGALLALHVLWPRLPVTIGRLLSGQKRCPRIGVSERLTAEGRAWHGEGLFSSTRAREFLRHEYGVRGFHVDSLAWGPIQPGAGDRSGDDPAAPLFVHAPFAIVTVSDACPWIGGRSSAAVSSCARPCRDGVVLLREPSMGREMAQRGKARFVETDPPAPGEREGGPSNRLVLYDDIP